MKTVHLTYNPYLVRTNLLLDGEPVNDPSSPFYRYLTDYRLQYWMEPREGWKGLMGELRSTCGTKEIELIFHGTQLDFQDVESLVSQEGAKYFERVKLVHENADTAGVISPESKLEELKDIFEEIKKGPVPEFHSEEVTKAFVDAINSDFELMVIAPMSSGKSTLINAILGKNVLPAINQATTAVITRIRDVDGKADFTVTADDRYGANLCKDEKATLAKITELNGALDPQDPEGKRALIKEISIEGDVKGLPAKGLHTVFVDTPGGNNSLNEEHGAVMDEAIANEDKSMVLYIFNGTQVSTQDNARILQKIADAMKRSAKGKQSRDRFLFVANRMDDVDPSKESYESIVETIKKSLAEVGITDPNLFLVSAQTAKLIRMRAANDPTFTESDDDEIDNLCKKMTRETRPLYEFSTLSETQKSKFRKRIAELREQYPDEKRIPEIAEIQSGIPAVEVAITEYLEKYALSIKLKAAQDSFGMIVQEKEIVGKAQRRWAESDESFREAQAQAAELAQKLKNDKTLEGTFAAIEKIAFDAAPFRKEMTGFDQTLQELARKYQGHDKISVNEASDLQDQLAREIQPIQVKVVKLAENVEKEVTQQCDKAMEEYRKNLETLRKNGLLDIGGIRVDQLVVFKKSKRELDTNINDYRRSREVSYTVRVRDSGIFGFIKRIFGGGYHDEERTRTEEYVDFGGFTRDSLGKMRTELLKDVKGMVDTAGQQVEAIKCEAKKQSQQISDIVRQVAADFEAKTQSRDQLKKDNEEDLIALRFAEEINRKVETILEV